MRPLAVHFLHGEAKSVRLSRWSTFSSMGLGCGWPQRLVAAVGWTLAARKIAARSPSWTSPESCRQGAMTRPSSCPVGVATGATFSRPVPVAKAPSVDAGKRHIERHGAHGTKTPTDGDSGRVARASSRLGGATDVELSPLTSGRRPTGPLADLHRVSCRHGPWCPTSARAPGRSGASPAPPVPPA